MCVDADSRPPIPPIAGGAADARDFRLTSADGTRFMAHAARAASPTGAGMVVIPDVRGLHPYYKELADRFAEVGVDAVAIDFFARTAPTDDRGESFDFMAQVPQTKPDALQADIAAAVAHLRGREGGQVRAVFSVGFCFGGALSYLQAASGVGYAGVIAFYGWPLGLSRWPDRPKPIDAVPRYTCPVLSLFGGADEGIPQSAVDQFDAACRRAGVRHEFTVYPGAPHSFFDRKQTEFRDASADAWRRVQEFVRRNTAAA
jgi:carboxymethylenebutenolidase